jgi:hypothetical protein
VNLNDELLTAIDAALAGDWDQSHRIAQEFNDTTACWLHAVLHKIEGDEWNSRYWYARTQRAAQYEDYADPRAELEAIRKTLSA